MGIIAEQLMGRIEAMERQISDIHLTGPAVDQTTALRNLRDTLGQLESKIAQIEETMPNGSGPFDGPRNTQFMSPKELLPGLLGDHFKDKWRTWSYKTRDFLSQWDETLGPKLEKVESMSTPLTPEYIESQEISPKHNAIIKRFLLQRLEGEPAEVVRAVASKHGLEQYRTLAQL